MDRIMPINLSLAQRLETGIFGNRVEFDKLCEI